VDLHLGASLLQHQPPVFLNHRYVLLVFNLACVSCRVVSCAVP
jgi:hypothetical protein